MRRRAAPLGRRASAHAAVLRAVAASLAAALVAALGITSAGATARPTGSDAPGAAASAVPVALPATTGLPPSAGLGAHPRGAAPNGGVLAAAEQDDADHDGLAPSGADVSHRVRPVGPTVPGARPASGAPRAATGVASTVHGRAPPA